MRILLLILFFKSNFVLAHGEDQFGPHNGFLKMPGNFHTEVVLEGKHKLKIYLLDMQWKNPSMKNAQVKVILNDKADALCKPKKQFFLCEFSKNINLTKKGHLLIRAQREGVQGADVTYHLPLTLGPAAYH